ncbi:ABC transporter permease [Jannaschia sp. W003]|uniref:ABC transporter permease n=1 Tax=Jannaschia sp. W003 TaxID=2867012 RepID=UPI0021A37DC6|nr:ABC transporter permease subunit [Jannaschia sp. W003]UWQ20925.1 ABC transporter permease subunit [Jannaschia sp. W003]
MSLRARIYLLLVAGFAVGPFLPLVVQSLAFRWAWPALVPTWTWEAPPSRFAPPGWDYVLSPASRVWEATLNTVGIGLAVTLLCLAICLPAARVLGRGRFRGKGALEFAVSLPLVVPEAAVALALLMIAIRLGLAGTYAGIVLVHLIPCIPYMTRMLTAVWQGLGPEHEEAAALLGASPVRILWHVTLPMLMPGVLAGALFAFLVSTNVFLLTFLLGQGRVVTLPTLLFSKISGGTLDASAAGIALVAALPGLVLLAVSDRLIREEAFARGL